MKLRYYVKIKCVDLDFPIYNSARVFKFTTLKSAWEFYKRKVEYDFDYGSHYSETQKPKLLHDADAIEIVHNNHHKNGLNDIYGDLPF